MRTSVLTPRLGVRVAVTAAAVCAVVGSGVVIGRTTASCTVTVAPSVAPAVPPPPATAAPVPAADPRTRAGAVAAGERFTAVLAGELVTRPDDYRAAVAAIAAPSARADLLDRADAALTALAGHVDLAGAAARGVRVVVHTVPVTAHADSYDGTVARVRVWAVGVLAVDGSVAPTAVWAAGTYVVEWGDGGWHLDAVEDESELVPRTPQPATDGTALPPELRDLDDSDVSPR